MCRTFGLTELSMAAEARKSPPESSGPFPSSFVTFFLSFSPLGGETDLDAIGRSFNGVYVVGRHREKTRLALPSSV